jgi:hypothetical protein
VNVERSHTHRAGGRSQRPRGGSKVTATAHLGQDLGVVSGGIKIADPVEGEGFGAEQAALLPTRTSARRSRQRRCLASAWL